MLGREGVGRGDRYLVGGVLVAPWYKEGTAEWHNSMTSKVSLNLLNCEMKSGDYLVGFLGDDM